MHTEAQQECLPIMVIALDAKGACAGALLS